MPNRARTRSLLSYHPPTLHSFHPTHPTRCMRLAIDGALKQCELQLGMRVGGRCRLAALAPALVSPIAAAAVASAVAIVPAVAVAVVIMVVAGVETLLSARWPAALARALRCGALVLVLLLPVGALLLVLSPRHGFGLALVVLQHPFLAKSKDMLAACRSRISALSAAA